MPAIQHALWRGNRLSVHSWDFLRQNNYNMNSSLETHLAEMAVSSGGLRNRLPVNKPSGQGLRELHLPAKHPETCPESVCSCSTQVARDAISARLHNFTDLVRTEALELNCSWCRHDPADRHGSHANMRREKTDLSFSAPKASTSSSKGKGNKQKRLTFSTVLLSEDGVRPDHKANLQGSPSTCSVTPSSEV